MQMHFIRQGDQWLGHAALHLRLVHNDAMQGRCTLQQGCQEAAMRTCSQAQVRGGDICSLLFQASPALILLLRVM